MYSEKVSELIQNYVNNRDDARQSEEDVDNEMKFFSIIKTIDKVKEYELQDAISKLDKSLGQCCFSCKWKDDDAYQIIISELSEKQLISLLMCQLFW